MPQYPKPITDSACQALIVQPQIGRGGARVVYDVSGDTEVAIKEVHLPFTGANMLEWFIWNAVSNNHLRSVFGECITISETGRYLIMEKLVDIQQADYSQTPAVPVWINDLKPSNFGKSASGIIKLRDYAMTDWEQILAAAPLHKMAWQR